MMAIQDVAPDNVNIVDIYLRRRGQSHMGFGEGAVMVKMMIFLKRREGTTREAFADWWLTRHRPLAGRLGGLTRHCFNLLPEGSPFDAIVEQWFDTEADAEGCYDTPEGRAVAADSLQNVSARARVRAEERVFIPAASPWST